MKDGKPDRIRAAVKHNTMSMCILCFAVACFFVRFVSLQRKILLKKCMDFSGLLV